MPLWEPEREAHWEPIESCCVCLCSQIDAAPQIEEEVDGTGNL